MKSNVKVKFAVYMNSNATNFCRNTIQNGTNQLTNAVYGSVVSITQRPHALITKQNNNSIHNKAVIHCRLCSRCCHLESYFTHARMHTHTHTHTRLTALFPGKPIWILLKQETVSGSGICHMQVCTLLQTDNHASTPPLSFLQARCPSCRQTNSVKALAAMRGKLLYSHEKYSRESIGLQLVLLHTVHNQAQGCMCTALQLGSDVEQSWLVSKYDIIHKTGST